MADESRSTRGDLLCLYGEAMLAAQQLEEAMAGLLGVRREIGVIDTKLDAPEFDEEVEAIWSTVFERTAGALRRELSLSGILGEELETAVTARNLLAHHYIRDRLSASRTGAADLGKLTEATERFRSLTQRLEVERFSALHDAGLTDDEVTTPNEARRRRNYDPILDADVPPEPFEE